MGKFTVIIVAAKGITILEPALAPCTALSLVHHVHSHIELIDHVQKPIGPYRLGSKFIEQIAIGLGVVKLPHHSEVNHCKISCIRGLTSHGGWFYKKLLLKLTLPH